jgi:hypothetical protein
VLVGGQGPAAPDDADWEAFCARIGWQRAEAALPDDYEERLAARVFAEHPGAAGPAGAAVEQALRAAQIALAARIAESAGKGDTLAGEAGHWRRRAWAMMAVAAVLCVAASAVLWRGHRPQLDAQACPDVETSPRATIAPIDDRAAPVDPTDPRRAAEPPARRPSTKDAPTTPAPAETKPRKPVAPGALVARRWRRRVSPPVRLADSIQSVRGVTPAWPRDLHDDATGSPSPVDLRGPAPQPDRPDASPAPRGITLAARTLPAIPRAWPEARAPEAWVQPASFRPGPAPASGTWSLSPESPRWYGMTLPPSIASTGVPSGLGVIGQLDLGKALSRL